MEDPDEEVRAAAITKRNEQESPLLRLPGELRNAIYRHVLPGNIDIKYGGKARDKVDMVALSTACRTLHQETALLLFSQSTFRFDSVMQIYPFSGSLTARQREEVRSIALPGWLLVDEILKNRLFPNRLPRVREVSVYPIGGGKDENLEERLMAIAKDAGLVKGKIDQLDAWLCGNRLEVEGDVQEGEQRWKAIRWSKMRVLGLSRLSPRW